jgi:hypothetical protein
MSGEGKKNHGSPWAVMIFVAILAWVAVPLSVSTFRPQVATAQIELPKTEDQDVQIQEERRTNLDNILLRARISQVRDFGNGVYEFPFVGAMFKEVLAEFKGTHTNLEFVSACGEVVLVNPGASSHAYGVTKTYTVVFKEK